MSQKSSNQYRNPFKYAIIVGVVGVIVSGLVIYVERTMFAVNSHNQPYIALGEYLKNISTKAHLWFEEAMSGDESIDMAQDVYANLDNSVVTLEAALAGKNTELGKFYITDDAETVAILTEAMKDVKELKAAAENRWKFRLETLKGASDGGATAGEEAGGSLDQEFDASYEELQQTYDRLVNHIKQNVAQDNSVLNNLSWASIVLIILVFSIMAFVLFRIQKRNDTLSEQSTSKLREETERLASFSEFVQAISNGNFNSELNMTDVLGNQLVKMRDTLRSNSESEQQRIWASTGLAQIGEILRSNYTTVGQLYDKIIQFVAKYSGSNQGFLFLLNEEDQNERFLELVAAYAFDRKKYLEKRIELGEGLVGQCFLEGQPIYMLDVPENYVKITSGLGGANPSCLLLMPLVINEKIYGIMELASFRKYEPHEKDLIAKFAESIASTISTVRNNERTRTLLQRTQQQAEEMRAQEEEMRQNMEELSATQEEMARKEQEYILRIKELEDLNNVERALRNSNSKNTTPNEITKSGQLIEIT